MEKIKIDLNSIPNVKCSCGSEFFENIFVIKRISALQSQSGREEIVPLAMMICVQCGKGLDEILSGSVTQ